MNTFIEKNGDSLYVIFRVLVGLGFLLHGLQKVPGVMEGKTSIFGLMALAMLIEVIAGAFTVLGLWVRPLAVIAALEMAYAFLFVHVKLQGLWLADVAVKSFNPLVNGGEAAMLYFAAFLVLATFGARKWSIDKGSKK